MPARGKRPGGKVRQDRLDWIFEEEADESLEARYDAWAATYDADHD